MSYPSTHDPRPDYEERVTNMLPLVHHVVSDVARHIPRFVDRDDLLSAGRLGLTQAAKSFDPERGVSFQAFARVRIRGAVLDELRSRDRLSRGTRGRATHLAAVTSQLHAELGRLPTDAEVARRMETDVADVRDLRDDVARAAGLERSSDPIGTNEAAELIPASGPGPMSQLLDAELRGYLIDAVAALPERLRLIIVASFFDGREMQEIAKDLGVTASRVSQLCSEAIALLRDGINSQLDPDQVADLGVTTGRVGRRKSAYYEAVANASSFTERLDRTRSIDSTSRDHSAVEASAA
jgi:RNA polymerase sigma factor for flagellar operon FliA